MKNWDPGNVLVCVFLMAVLVVVPSVMVGVGMELKQNQDYGNLPRIEISLNNVDLDSIKKNSKEIVYPDNIVRLIDGKEQYKYDDVEVKGRGNSTRWQEKIPLQIKFSEKVDLLGLGKRRKWILLANFFDPNNLRTSTAYYVEKMLDMNYAYEGRFVDLYVDGAYNGLYYLVRGIEVGKNAVDLKDPMGVLVELDNIYGKEEERYYVSGNGEVMTVKDSVAKDNVETAMNDFVTDFNKMEQAIRNDDFAELEKIIDVDSFAKYYLLSELIANHDAYFTSVYFYKDGARDKIHAGPAWDFDIALDKDGGLDPEQSFSRRDDFADYVDPEAQYGNHSKLFARLIEMPEFRARVGDVFEKYLHGCKKELLKQVSNDAAKIYKSAFRDGEKWGKKNFVGEVDRMLKWIDARYDYMEKEYSVTTYNVLK